MLQNNLQDHYIRHLSNYITFAKFSENYRPREEILPAYNSITCFSRLLPMPSPSIHLPHYLLMAESLKNQVCTFSLAYKLNIRCKY